MFTQADWTSGTPARRALFEHVRDALNWQAGRLDFEVQDDVTGPLIRHLPTEARLGVRPSMPADDLKPFDIRVRLTHRFPMRNDGSFNTALVLQRVREIADLKIPEVQE